MKFLTNLDLNKNQLLNVVVQKLATPPANPVAGQMYYDTEKNRLFVYNGSQWVGADAEDAVMSGSDIVDAINSSSAIIDDDNLSQAVRDAIAKAHNTHSIADITGLQAALDDKVDNDRVLTDVPANAKFTDTITTINGKTGAITKSDIVALGIPAQDTTYSVFNTTRDGLAPKSDGTSTKYLRADGTWAIPPDTKYTLPVATSTTLGGVKIGNNIEISADGIITVKNNGHEHTIANITGLQEALDIIDTKAGEALGAASIAEDNAKAYTDNAIAALIGSAPEVLDTLEELAEALANDPNFATTITTELAKKTNKYVKTIGDGSNTSFEITHNLGTRDIAITIRETSTPYAQVITDVEMTTENTITVKFAQPPKPNEYTVTIVG